LPAHRGFEWVYIYICTSNFRVVSNFRGSTDTLARNLRGLSGLASGARFITGPEFNRDCYRVDLHVKRERAREKEGQTD